MDHYSCDLLQNRSKADVVKDDDMDEDDLRLFLNSSKKISREMKNH